MSLSFRVSGLLLSVLDFSFWLPKTRGTGPFAAAADGYGSCFLSVTSHEGVRNDSRALGNRQ